MNSPLTPFVKLADPSTYIACAGNLSIDTEARLHWTTFFKRHFETILKLAVAAGEARGQSSDQLKVRATECRVEFNTCFDAFAADPDGPARRGNDRVTILVFDKWRDEILRKYGFVDAFVDLKNRENATAITLLPLVCRELDALKGEEQIRAVIEGVFAGNIFDMGAEATAKAYLNSSPDFFATRKTLAQRPWLIDDFDALSHRLQRAPYHKAVFFIDNAGSDFLLGAVPMIRYLAQRGTKVVLAANERPTLNDMTIHDVNNRWPRMIEAEPSLGELPIERVSTGTGEPLIDLLEVSPELNAASVDADLIILEGMGRGVESNLDAAFSCDALNLAMIKDIIIAKHLGGKLYDVVCRFR